MSSKHALEDLCEAQASGVKFFLIKSNGEKRTYRFDAKKGLLLIHQAYQIPSKLTINEVLQSTIELIREPKRHIELEVVL
jgi:hypothetical protein